MRLYEQLRKDRLDRGLDKFAALVDAIEAEYMKTSNMKVKLGKGSINTNVMIDMRMTPELGVFLSDYVWVTGIPLVVQESEGRVFITITESAFTHK